MRERERERVFFKNIKYFVSYYYLALPEYIYILYIGFRPTCALYRVLACGGA